MTIARRRALGVGLALLALGGGAVAAAGAPASGQYFPPAGQWAHKPPAEAGLDPAALAAAVAYAQSRETERAR